MKIHVKMCPWCVCVCAVTHLEQSTRESTLFVVQSKGDNHAVRLGSKTVARLRNLLLTFSEFSGCKVAEAYLLLLCMCVEGYPTSYLNQ